MSVSGREAPPDFREWSRGHPGCLGVVGRPYPLSAIGREAPWMSESGQQGLPDIREWSGGPRRCTGVVGRPSWISGCGQETLSEVRD